MTKLEFIDKINDILIGLNTAESDALGSLYDELMRDAGWHPASELPPEEGEYIAIDNGMPDVFRVDYLELFGWCVEVMGAHEVVNIKWWCYPPKEEE